MPVPHLSVSAISRSTGASAVERAAYRHATQMEGPGGEPTRQYGGKADELKHSEIALPDSAPPWAVRAYGTTGFAAALKEVLSDAAAGRIVVGTGADGAEPISMEQAEQLAWARLSERLWNDIEHVETTQNKFPTRAMLAREITIALPRVLSRSAQIDLVQGFVREAFTSRGTVVDWVLHDTGDGNPHVHMMLPTRFLDVDAWGGKDRRLHDRAEIRAIRRTWERHANMVLEREGFPERIDMRSLRDQGIMLEPESYNARIAENAEKAGGEAKVKIRCEEVRERNQAYLRKDPEHIIAVVQQGRAAFTKRDLIATLADRLDLTPETLPEGMAAKVTESPLLVPMAVKAPDGEQLYITQAKAGQGMRLQAEAAALAQSAMAPELVSAGDAVETGSGPILVDVGPVVAAREEEARAAEARARREREPVPQRAKGRRPQISVDAVREALKARADDLFSDAFGQPVRPGASEWRAKANEGIAMQMRGEKRGLWRDHTAGEGGDVMDLAARVLCGLDSARADFPRVLRTAAGWCGIAPTEAPSPNRVAELRRERERAAAAEEAREAKRRAKLVRSIAERAVPVAGTPAASYLARRGLTAAPGEGLAYLPPVPGLGVRSPEAASLVVWARDADGTIQGGQRILIDTDGAAPDTDVRKPAFGAISGVPARFPAADATLAKGPLIIAEGPESALSAWEATGLETWAVFGVSGFAAAPIPEGRKVILAPDRDAPESPAGQAFRKAVAEHLERGRDLRIALAPEPSGSKSDLNDTLQRADLEEVKAAIDAARPVQAWLPATLNRGQREAAEAMLGPDRLTLVKGHAGTGKTTSLRAVAAAWQARGVEVLAGAPSGKATQELGRIDGVRAATLSAWESRWERGDVPKEPFVFLLDEAGMVGVEQWSRIQSRVLAMGGKLVGIGDPEQLRPVGDLSGWAAAEFAANRIPVIGQVLRQSDEGDRKAVTALARGREGISKGLDHFLATGAVRLEPEVLADPVAAVAAAYWNDPDGRKMGEDSQEPSRIALAFSNRDVDALNSAIRAEAVARGIVNDAEAIEVRTARERRVKAQGGGARTWRTEVTIRIGKGDRVLLTRPAPELGLPRSGFGTVTDAGEGRLEILVDGRDEPVEIDPAAFPHLDHGFAATVHKAQGMTADIVSVLPHARMDGHATYVALSRHKDKVTVYGRRGHLETAKDLYRMGARVAEPPAPKPGRARPAVRMPEAAATDRPDWIGGRRGGEGELRSGLAGDPHLMSVASRMAGLLAADRAEGDPLLRNMAEAAGSRDDFTGEPKDAVETLVARHGVIRAEELAAVLAAPVADPETFLRLFSEAVEHPDLVALPGGDALREGDAYVYTTTRHLRDELAATDRAMRMAARAEAVDAPPAVEATEPLSPSQEAALAYAMRAGAEGGGLAIVKGGPGSGRTRLAAEAARAHEAAGRVVTVIAATEAGLRVMERMGLYPLTLQQWLAEPPVAREDGDPPHVVIFDDAHAFGALQADAALARAEAVGAGVVAVLDPSRRPQLGGAVFRAVSDRVGAAALEGLHGIEGRLAETVGGLAAGGGRATAALSGLRERGCVTAAGDRAAALRRVAAEFTADSSEDRIALAWSRTDAEALTAAIRDVLDERMPERAAERRPGPLGDLKPGDRIRFTVAGWAGTSSGKGRRGMIVRGDRAEVLEALPGGGLRMRLTGFGGTREMDVVPEGPLPRWSFAFASTIAAAAGSRHDSVHILASPGLDRATLAAAAVTATGDLRITLPVPEDRAAASLSRIAGRERTPRSAVDHGFDPALAARAAEESALPALARPAARVPEDGMAAEPGAGLAAVPEVRLAAVRARRANTAYLKTNPEHVLAIVQSDRPVFTEADVRRALRERLGASLQDGEIAALGDRVLQSEHLVALAAEAPDGAPQYMTTARAMTMRAAHADARRLAAGRFAPGTMPVERGDVLDGLNPGQATAAEAMLGPDRLTLVQGHAGTGKTHTLRRVAEAWRARGVEVLAGAPSGKAAAELRAIDGVEAATLASWEARWHRGDVPKRDGFVFVMDEAGMVGAGAWSRIQERVLEMGGKLIAVGDPDQLQPVSDMPGWAIAERAAGQGHVTVIDRVVRQSDPLDAEATRSLALGGANVREAVRHYDGKGALRLGGEVRADPVSALARAHAEDMAAHPDATRIAVAYTNRDVHRLNDAIRAEALSRGAIDPETVRRYGMVRRVERGDAGRERISRVPRDLGVGDRIILREANRDLGLPRSSFATVTATAEDSVTAVFDGREDPVMLDRDVLEAVDYGHAATIHKSQGMTADAAFVLPHRGMHRHAAYVALSRHRERLAVFGRAGHLDRPADLVRMAQAAGHLDLDLGDGNPVGAPETEGAPTPWDAPAGLAGRADWRAQGVEAGRGGFVGDARLMSVAERVIGLMAAGGGVEPDADVRDPENLAQEPGRAVDVILRRASVFRAEDVADQIARVSRRDPDTFLRLFREAMDRPDLVVLAADDGRGGGPVWTTEARLETELGAVDRGIRLALGPAPADAPEPVRLAPDFARSRGLSPTQEAAVRSAARASRLRLVAGTAGGGRSSVAAIVADVHSRAGWKVLGTAPTGAGVDGLREAGLRWRRAGDRGEGPVRPMTLHALERDLDEGRIQLDSRTVILVDDAGRIGADRASWLLEQVEKTGAKLVAFLDDGAAAPMEAGPVFRALRTRLGASRLDDSFRWSPRRAIVMGELVRGGEDGHAAIEALIEDGCLVAAGDRRRAVSSIANAYVNDASWSKVAVAWSRKDADALTAEILRRLDSADPERRGFEPDAEGPLRNLKPGDRIRFTSWTPRDAGVPKEHRFLAGEIAEFRGRDEAGRALFRVQGRDGAMRDAALPDGTDIPEWRYGFAGTIAGETGRVTDSVHMLAAPGMSRQLLATGARLHGETLRIVAPVDESGLARAMGRILDRDATPESVLDHGFDPALAAREAMRGRSLEIETPPPRPGTVSRALARLREIARLGDPAPQEAPLRGLEGEVMAEVIGASVLRHGAAPEGRERLALESHVAALADPAGWRRMLRQVPSGTVGQADALALEVAGAVPGDPSGRAPTAARILARGALTARDLGEGTVAELFEDGLRLYGNRASVARALGRPEELAPPVVTEREAAARNGALAGVDPERAEAAAGGPDRQGPAAGAYRMRRGVRGAGVSRMLDDLEMSDERLAEEAFGIFLPKRRRSRAARVPPRRVERAREELRLGGDWAGRAEAVKAAREAMRAAADRARLEAEADRPDRETAVPVAEEKTRTPPAPEARAPSPDEDIDPARIEIEPDFEPAWDVPGETRRDAAVPDLALRLAIAVSARCPFGAAVHGQDLQKGIAALLERAKDVDGIAALQGRSDGERDLIAAVGAASASVPLPEADALRSARSDLIAELAAAGVSPDPRPDLGERLVKSFTQGEILALHDARRPWPESLPQIDRDTRRDVAMHLQTFAPLADPKEGPSPDPLPVIVTMLARPESRETVAELARSFSLDQFQALRDPGGNVPEGLAGLGADGRTRIAEAFRTGSVPEREDARPDPRLADDVLVLSCAVSERVDAAAPVHRASLPRDVEAVLRDSMLARDVPEAEVDELAFGIARKRAETDLRVSVVRGIDPDGRAEAGARFHGNPDFDRQSSIDAYRAGVAKGMRRLHREDPVPTQIELRVARAVVATHGTDRHGLALAMAEALERGTTPAADGIRKEREAVLGQLRDGTGDLASYDRRTLLRKVYRSFTGAEIREISEGRGPLLGRLPDDRARGRVREELMRLHRDIGYPEPAPWRARHEAVARSAGADRHQGRERGLTAEIE